MGRLCHSGCFLRANYVFFSLLYSDKNIFFTHLAKINSSLENSLSLSWFPLSHDSLSWLTLSYGSVSLTALSLSLSLMALSLFNGALSLSLFNVSLSISLFNSSFSFYHLYHNISLSTFSSHLTVKTFDFLGHLIPYFHPLCVMCLKNKNKKVLFGTFEWLIRINELIIINDILSVFFSFFSFTKYSHIHLPQEFISI